MLWGRKKVGSAKPATKEVTFVDAKEATRRAAFLNVAQGMTADEGYRQSLAGIFRVCRAHAIAAGAAEGYSETDVDASIGEICDADTIRMKAASDEEFRQFAKESGEVVKTFLAATA